MSAHTDNERSEAAVDVPRLVRHFKCFACSHTFTETDDLARHEQNEHPNEYHAAMVREMYGYSDIYDFEPNSQR